MPQHTIWVESTVYPVANPTRKMKLLWINGLRLSVIKSSDYPPTTHPRFYHWGAFLNICGELASGISAALSHGNRSSPPIAR